MLREGSWGVQLLDAPLLVLGDHKEKMGCLLFYGRKRGEGCGASSWDMGFFMVKKMEHGALIITWCGFVLGLVLFQIGSRS